MDWHFLAILLEDEVVFGQPCLGLAVFALHYGGDRHQTRNHLDRGHLLLVLIRALRGGGRASLSPPWSGEHEQAQYPSSLFHRPLHFVNHSTHRGDESREMWGTRRFVREPEADTKGQRICPVNVRG